MTGRPLYTCYACARIIKGEVTHYVPPLLAIQLGEDFQKAYHPKCYDAAEAKAAQELGR